MRRNCLITGASAGIGKEYAILMAQFGYNLILVARREDRLNQLSQELKAKYGTNTFNIVQDLSEDNAVDKIIAKINEEGLAVDALINNAGYGLPGTFDGTEWKQQDDFLKLMLIAPTELAHKCLKGMKARGFGRIINVASLAGLLPGSVGHTLYSATKSYLIKFSQSLNLEYQNTGVHITALCPGFTYSEFHDVNGTRHLVSQLPKYMWLDAKSVATKGFDAVEKNKPMIVTGLANQIIAAVCNFLPFSTLHFLSSKFTKIVRGDE